MSDEDDILALGRAVADAYAERGATLTVDLSDGDVSTHEPAELVAIFEEYALKQKVDVAQLDVDEVRELLVAVVDLCRDIVSDGTHSAGVVALAAKILAIVSKSP